MQGVVTVFWTLQGVAHVCLLFVFPSAESPVILYACSQTLITGYTASDVSYDSLIGAKRRNLCRKI
jgi:hypothetical protein